MKTTRRQQDILAAIDCVRDVYHDHIARLQGEEFASIPILEKERTRIIRTLKGILLDEKRDWRVKQK